MKKLIFLLLFMMLFTSCSNNSKPQKEVFNKIGKSSEYYNYSIGKTESVFLYCFGNSEMDSLIYDNLMENSNYSFVLPKILSKEYDKYLSFESEYIWNSTIKITCIKEFDKINIDTLYLEFDKFIIEIPCNILLTYNENYAKENQLVDNIDDFNKMKNDYSNTGLIPMYDNDETKIIGIAPFYLFNTEQNVFINEIISMDNTIEINTLKYANGYLNNKSWKPQELTYEDLELPFKVETNKKAYTYIMFSVPNDQKYYTFGIDVRITFEINGDLYINNFHVVF